MLNRRKWLVSCFLVSLASIPSNILQAQNEPIWTWHNNNDRNAVNHDEQILTLANVNSTSFGKVGFYATDGAVDGQPLYVPALKVGGIFRDVLYVATENDSVYAFDAFSGAVLWKTSVLLPGETASDNRGCSQITPKIGITSTPVIDPAKGPHGAIYVVNMAKNAQGKYAQRLNALDLTTGAQLFGGPTHINSTYPGTGDDSVNGRVVFYPGQYAERAGLLEWNGAIYTAWTSHCDSRPYTGWIISYDATTLQEKAVINLTPNGSEGSIWMSGAGLAANANQILFLDANGTFDTDLDSNGNPIHQDYGNGFISLTASANGLKVSDYYETDNTVQESNSDTDLGSGGAVLVSPIIDNSGNSHSVAVGTGKDHNIYVVDTNNLGKFHPNGGYIYQVLTNALPNGAWSSPAYFDNKIYYGGVDDTVKAFSFSNAKLVTTPASLSTMSFPYPGTTPSISANGTSNGIVWAVKNVAPPVLYALNAEDLSQELYDSTQAGTRDQLAITNRFITPTISFGHVFVGTQTGVAVYGLLGK